MQMRHRFVSVKLNLSCSSSIIYSIAWAKFVGYNGSKEQKEYIYYEYLMTLLVAECVRRRNVE
jgi:hypothetical protein